MIKDWDEIMDEIGRLIFLNEQRDLTRYESDPLEIQACDLRCDQCANPEIEYTVRVATKKRIDLVKLKYRECVCDADGDPVKRARKRGLNIAQLWLNGLIPSTVQKHLESVLFAEDVLSWYHSLYLNGALYFSDFIAAWLGENHPRQGADGTEQPFEHVGLCMHRIRVAYTLDSSRLTYQRRLSKPTVCGCRFGTWWN
jgi:hypothetical protein